MFDEHGFDKIPPSQKAAHFYNRGVDFKKSGDIEAALIEFRRAVLADPAHFQSQFEIGLICLAKSRKDPFFTRYAFNAFQVAARHDLLHQEAHDKYIMMAQKMGRLDELLREYENLTKFNPENELLNRCKKNILTISMALMPDKVNVTGNPMSGMMGKMILFGSLGMILVGIGMLLVPVIMKKAPPDKSILFISLMPIGIGTAGLVIRSRLK